MKTPNDIKNDFFYTIDEVADMLKLTPTTVRTYVNKGKINAIKLGKSWRITPDDLKNFFNDSNSDLK